MKQLEQRPSFGLLREPTRTVGNDCTIEVDPNGYSVSWRLIGERVAMTVPVHGQAVRRLSARRHAHLMVSLVVAVLSVEGKPTA